MQQFAVIGLGQFGLRLALQLTEAGAEVMGIDVDPQVVDAVRGRVDQPVVLDATDPVAFRASGVEHVDTAVVAIGRLLDVSILVTAQLKRLGVRHIVARASSDLHEEILRSVGAHQVTNPEQDMGDTIAQRLLAPNVHGRTILGHGFEWAEVDTPPEFWGARLGELELEERFDARLIAVIKHQPRVAPDGGSVFEAVVQRDPGPDLVVGEGDRLAVVATTHGIRELGQLALTGESAR